MLAWPKAKVPKDTQTVEELPELHKLANFASTVTDWLSKMLSNDSVAYAGKL